MLSTRLLISECGRGERGAILGLGTMLLLLLLVAGCRAPFLGGPSVTLLSSEPTHPVYRPIGSPVHMKECNWVFLLFGGGTTTHHEAMVDRVLEDTGADVILNARLDNTVAYFFLGARSCVEVRGQPAELLHGGES